MRSVALRDFQQRGAAALGDGLRAPLLLTGRGARYFLVPVQGDDVDLQYRELVKALGSANLRAWQLRAKDYGLDRMSAAEIDVEVRAARVSAQSRRKSVAPTRRRRSG